MPEWSKRAAQHFLEKDKADKKRKEEEEQRTQIRDRKILLDQEILQRRAPAMWDDLTRRFESSCADFNSEVGREVLMFRKINENHIEFTQESVPSTKWKLLFDPQDYTIDFRLLDMGVAGVQRLDIKIPSGASEPGFFENTSGLRKDPAEIVEEFLNSLIGL